MSKHVLSLLVEDKPGLLTRVAGLFARRGFNIESLAVGHSEIDGLSRSQFERAVAKGNLPFLAKLQRRGHFTLESFYSGMPSTTPAVQAELFYGVRAAVPGFQFLHRASGQVMRMYEADSSAEIEAGLRKRGEDPRAVILGNVDHGERRGAARLGIGLPRSGEFVLAAHVLPCRIECRPRIGRAGRLEHVRLFGLRFRQFEVHSV